MARKRSVKSIFKFSRRRFRSIFRVVFKLVPLGFAASLILFLSIGVRQMLHADPYFQVEKITVFPAGILTSAEIQYLESKTKGQSLLEINLHELSQSLERNPKIQRAEVVRVLPQQLNIFLTRRLPVFQVQTRADGPFFLISSDQLILAVLKQPRPDFVVVEDYTSSKKDYSVGMLYQNRFIRSAVEIHNQIQTDLVFDSEIVTKLTVDQIGSVSIFLKDGLELKAGKRIQISNSARLALGSLLKSSDRSELMYLDLRYRDIIIRKKSTGHE